MSETSEKKSKIQLFLSESQYRTQFFKWDGKVTKIWHLLFQRIWKNKNFISYFFKLKDRRSSQDDDDEHDGDGIETGELREQDRFLPIANVARIMKKAIPTQVIANYF